MFYWVGYAGLPSIVDNDKIMKQMYSWSIDLDICIKGKFLKCSSLRNSGEFATILTNTTVMVGKDL